MLNLVDLLCLVLAANQAVEIWRHSRLFASRRDRVDQGLPPVDLPAACLDRLTRHPRLDGFYQLCANFSVELLSCPWCTSVWAGGLLWLLWNHLPFFGQFLVMSLAVSRGANLVNDLAYPCSRTPKGQ